MSDAEKLQEFISEIERLIDSQCVDSSPDFSAWQLKVQRLLTKHYGNDSLEVKTFENIQYRPVSLNMNEGKAIFVETCRNGLNKANAILNALAEDMDDEAQPDQKPSKELEQPGREVFIVYGHQPRLKKEIARFVSEQGLEPVTLDTLPNDGQTLKAKLSQVLSRESLLCAICLFTADDLGQDKKKNGVQERPRQNVVYETGLVTNSVGEEHVIYIVEKGVELPSDLRGIAYIDAADWEDDLLTELRSIKEKAGIL